MTYVDTVDSDNQQDRDNTDSADVAADSKDSSQTQAGRQSAHIDWRKVLFSRELDAAIDVDEMAELLRVCILPSKFNAVKLHTLFGTQITKAWADRMTSNMTKRPVTDDEMHVGLFPLAKMDAQFLFNLLLMHWEQTIAQQSTRLPALQKVGPQLLMGAFYGQISSGADLEAEIARWYGQNLFDKSEFPIVGPIGPVAVDKVGLSLHATEDLFSKGEQVREFKLITELTKPANEWNWNLPADRSLTAATANATASSTAAAATTTTTLTSSYPLPDNGVLMYQPSLVTATTYLPAASITLPEDPVVASGVQIFNASSAPSTINVYDPNSADPSVPVRVLRTGIAPLLVETKEVKRPPLELIAATAIDPIPDQPPIPRDKISNALGKEFKQYRLDKRHQLYFYTASANPTLMDQIRASPHLTWVFDKCHVNKQSDFVSSPDPTCADGFAWVWLTGGVDKLDDAVKELTKRVTECISIAHVIKARSDYGGWQIQWQVDGDLLVVKCMPPAEW